MGLIPLKVETKNPSFDTLKVKEFEKFYQSFSPIIKPKKSFLKEFEHQKSETKHILLSVPNSVSFTTINNMNIESSSIHKSDSWKKVETKEKTLKSVCKNLFDWVTEE